MSTLDTRWQAVAHAPFAEQLALIQEVLAESTGLGTLVRITANLRDHEPFARVLAGIVAADRLSESSLRGALTRALDDLPPAGLARALGPGSLGGSPVTRTSLGGLLAQYLHDLPVERVAESCLILRWLGRHASGILGVLRNDAVKDSERALEDGQVDVADRTLLLLPGNELPGLDALADRLGLLDAWVAHRAAFAERLLLVLCSQPKPLSLARAEELLSRQIYTDPGHFLAELLQNADDAGATTWRVTFTDDAVEVWHDGEVFDARDVVGVLSIGQTTKTQAHIGLFGVGFKAVYAVCERPQIFSDVYAFEIADVSIPRPLSATRAVGTRLVLPLRDPQDAERGSAALARRARSLPAPVLLTLRHVRTVEIIGEGGPRTARSLRRLTRRPGPAEDTVVLAEEGVGGRSQRTVLLARHTDTEEVIAVALDSAGGPQPWPAGEPSVYAFLPTRQRSGLPFLVHARFAVPVDRERIHVDHTENEAALARLGGLFADLVRRKVADGVDVRRLVGLAPRAAEVAEPIFAAAAAGFAAGMAGVAWLRDVEHHPVAVAQARLVPDEGLARALAPAPGLRPVPPLPARVQAVAVDLGISSLDSAQLRALLAEAAGARAPWLRAAMGGVLRFLARAGWSLEGLAELALFPDTERGLHPAAGLRRASPDLRMLAARPLLDAGLDAEAALASLWARLKLPTLTAAEVLEDLVAHAPSITQRAGAARVLRWLAAQPADLTVLSTSPFLPDEGGGRRPATGPEALWLPPEGPLGAWLRTLRPRPALAAPELAAHRDVLHRLGARVLDLPAILGLYESGGLRLTDAALDALHDVLAEIHLDLPGRHLEVLASAPIFPTQQGDRRALVGAERALVPAEAGLRALLPTVPWLRGDLAADLPHVLRLPVVALTADHLARRLAGRPPPELAQAEVVDVGAALAFVATRAERISGPTRQALAQAPVWPARDGTRHPLATLRLPAADPRVAAVYRALATWPPAAPETLDLAASLGLDEHLRTPDLTRLVVDLTSVPDDLAAVPPAVLFGALAAAGESLPPSRLLPLMALDIYPTVEGVLAPLGHWDAPDRGGAHRVPEALAEVVDHTGRRRLAPAAESALLPLLEALRIRPAGLVDVVGWVPHFFNRPAALDAVRALLVRSTPPLPPGVEHLPIWPSAAGGYAAASSLVRPRSLADADLAGIVEVPLEGRLDVSAEPDADAVGDAVRFRSPVQLLLTRLQAEARPGEPLADQPPWLATPGQVARLLGTATADPGVEVGQLPLVVDAWRCLTTGPRLEATFDEIHTVARTPLMDRLAEPTWALAARDVVPELVPRLSARSWLEALAEHTASAVPAASHPTFAEPEAREALYRAVWARREMIAADEPARAALGRACVFPTPDGLLRSANNLLFEPGPPGLDVSWNPTEEVPPLLCDWLRSVYALEKKRLHTLVEHVVEAHHAVVEGGDGEKSANLLGFLCRALRIEADRPEPATEQAERFKLGKRLKVEARTGGFHRPRALLAPTRPEVIERLVAFLPTPPLEVHPRYDAATRLLLRAAGAAPDVDEAQLRTWIHEVGMWERERRVAFARYVFERVARSPRTVDELGLRDKAWVPDETGGLRAPPTLYWHTPAVVALLGMAPDLFPAVGLRTGVVEATWRKLGFREADDARLSDVLARVPAGGALDESVLRWLDDQLDGHRLSAEAVRTGLGDGAWFIADDDTRHSARTLIRDLPPGEFGRRRGGFSVGRTLPRLVAALRIPVGPAPRHYLDFLDEISTAFLAQGEALLVVEPELAEVLPRVWTRLAEAQATPDRGVVVAEGPALVPCWTSDPRLVWPQPASLVAAARTAGLPLLTVYLGDAAPDVLRTALAGAGVPLADALWQEAGPPLALRPAPRVDVGLTDALNALWSLGDGLRRWPAPWRSDFGSVPSLQVASHVSRQGHLLGAPLTWPVGAAVVGNALIVNESWQGDGHVLADALCRDRLAEGRPRADQVALVADLLACGHARAMGLLLDARRPEPGEVVVRKGPPPLPAAALEAPAPEKAGMLARFKRWLTSEQPAAAPPPPVKEAQLAPAAPRPGGLITPRGAGGGKASDSRGFSDSPSRPFQADHDRFFRPGESVGPQLNDGRDWLEDRNRPAAYGFASAPRQLPPPWLYGPNLIADLFDPRTQHWAPEGIDPSWSAPAGESHHRLTLAGRLPAGESVLPVPLYGRLISVDAHPPALVIRTPGGLPLISTTNDTDVRCEIALDAPPDFETATQVPGMIALLRPTVPDTELPAECHGLVDRIGGLAPFERVLAVRDFIRANYRYDPTRFEDPRLAGWLRRLSQGRRNAQIAALHAGRDARHLGAGVCYELNVLAVELLRRSGTPAAVATGWVFDRGQVDEPDHLWALALLGTPDGPRWMPVDASTTREGRPLRVRPRTAGRWGAKLPERALEPPRPAAWTRKAAKVEGEALPIADLLRVARHLGKVTGESMDEAELRARCRELLADPEAAAKLVAVLMGE